jgi:tRNA uridine 5-carbamoylmethylation protein Kti12
MRKKRTRVCCTTNMGRQVRGVCSNLFAAYGARVRIVYVEVFEGRLHEQNSERPSPVHVAVIERLLGRWEVPDRIEAHQVDWVILT